MKKLILLLFGFVITNLLTAQVGINTTNPLAVFHIDGDGKNSATPTATELLNDVVVTEDGNLGIGSVLPSAKLDIVTEIPAGGFSLKDGNQLAGRILTCNNNGNATWMNPGTYPILRWTPSVEGVNVPYSGGDYINTGSYIELPPGKWIVHVIITVKGSTAYPNQYSLLVTTFADELTAPISPTQDFEVAGTIAGVIPKLNFTSTLTGFVIINNGRLPLIKRKYYYIAVCSAQWGDGSSGFYEKLGADNSSWAENNMVAYQLQ